MGNVVIQNYEIFGQTIQRVNTAQHEVHELVTNGVNDCRFQLQETENELMNSQNLLQIALAIEAEKYALWQAALAELEAALASMDGAWIASATAQEEYARAEYQKAVMHRQDMERRVSMAQQCVQMATTRLEETSSVYNSYQSQLNETIHVQCGRIMQADERIKNYLSVNQSVSANDNKNVNPARSNSEDSRKERGYYSSYEERIKYTPKEESDRGYWTGRRGESKYIPNDRRIKKILKKYGLDGIEYRNGIPDFSRVSESTNIIDNMTENRADNFRQCDEKCAEQWNKAGRNKRKDWTPRDVAQWRKDNGYSWHERNDMETCDLVPTEINDYFGHLGGVSECKKRDGDNFGGEFDE